MISRQETVALLRLTGTMAFDGRMAELNDLKTWTDRLGHSKLRSFTTDDGHYWLEQNANKASKWAKLAREGHQVAWEFETSGGSYTGRLLIDGEIYTTAEATRKFLRG